MSKKQLSEYGIQIKTALIRRNETQEWLISEVQKVLPKCYIDSSNLHKIMTGQIKESKLIPAINQILNLSDLTGDGNEKT